MSQVSNVATRYLYARSLEAAGTDEDIKQHLPAFTRAFNDLSLVIALHRAKGTGGTDHILRFESARPIGNMIRAGVRVVDGILSTRSIPARDTKSMELAYRLVVNSKRLPKDIYKWWDTNVKRLEFIMQAANTWPPKQEGSDELFTLGAFKIHNTVGAKGSELDSLKTAIERVESLVRKNPIPGFSRVLYGDIHVVARITKAHHAAWYFPGDDSVYLRRTKATGLDEVLAMIHELGHRYWHRFATDENKKEWLSHHRKVGDKDFEVELPGVGEKLPVKVPRIKTYPTITKIEGGRFYYEFDLGDGGEKITSSLPTATVWQFYRERQRVSKNFPTAYSSTDAQEHFCDALALLAMGNLTDEHKIPFLSIWDR